MTAKRPEEIHEMFARHFSAGDIEKLMALYEPGAALAPQPGQVVAGLAAIREALGGFLALKGRFQITFESKVEAGDVALLFSRWTLSGKGPDGSPLSLAGRTADVVRRQKDGGWLLVIDNPWGGGA